jgi:hypothetical protein
MFSDCPYSPETEFIIVTTEHIHYFGHYSNLTSKVSPPG